ncbi:transposase [Thermus caldilimi]|uniref:transposase n=1 Tax=Thermus caldilimi TaxID=2483360 RepID=UPI001075F04F|nr:transposase [Thermus caldilimi]
MRSLPFGPEALRPFVSPLLDAWLERHEEKVARLLWAILASGSARKSDWARAYRQEATEEANYKAIDRLLPLLEPQRYLLRLLDPKTPFLLVDPTEVPRPQAKRTPYVGRLSDGKTLGFWAVVLAQPYEGRAVPVYVGSYWEGKPEGRNRTWEDWVEAVREYVEEGTVWVFDREFSFAGWLEALERAGVRYAVRLNLGTRPRLEWRGERLVPWVDRGREVRYEGVRYRGEVEVNLVGVWREGMREALWVMGNLPPEELLGVYEERMKIEEGFRDLKGHMGFAGVMSKGWEAMEKTLALVALAYGVGLLVGEEARRRLKGGARREGGSGGYTRGSLSS